PEETAVNYPCSHQPGVTPLLHPCTHHPLGFPNNTPPPDSRSVWSAGACSRFRTPPASPSSSAPPSSSASIRVHPRPSASIHVHSCPSMSICGKALPFLKR